MGTKTRWVVAVLVLVIAFVLFEGSRSNPPVDWGPPTPQRTAVPGSQLTRAIPPATAGARQTPPPTASSFTSSTEITEVAKKSISAQIAEAQYWFTKRGAHGTLGDGIAAPNRGQQMNVHFDQGGLSLSPWSGTDDPEWSFRVGTGGGSSPVADKARASYEHPGGQDEWFDNSARGIEHGMTLAAPISSIEEPISLTFPIETELHGESGNANQILFKDASGQTQLRYEQLYAYDATGREVPTELAWHDDRREVSWAIHHQGFDYPLTIDPLITRSLGKLTASDGARFDFFGSAVSVSVDTLAVGAPGDDDDIGDFGTRGAVYLFSRDQGGSNQWGEVKKVTASDGVGGNPFGGDFFGASVSLSGDTLAVGASSADIDGNADQGAVYIYRRDQGGSDQWGEVRKLTAGDGAAQDKFGGVISLSGDTLAVGVEQDAVGANLFQGSVYVFGRDHNGSDQWGEVKQLIASDGAASDRFGTAVSLFEDTLAVGSRLDNSTQGSAYLFMRDEGGINQWGEVKKITPSAGAEAFGSSVFLYGDTLAVGAPREDRDFADQGSAYLFMRNQDGSNQWGEIKKLTVSGGGAFDQFGTSVSLFRGTLAVGADGGGSIGNGAGSVHLFSRNEGGNDQWGQTAKLTASDGSAGDEFGAAVSLFGDTLAIGSPKAGIGGDENVGSAYLFESSQASWTPTQIIAPPAETGVTTRLFGKAIAATDDTLVIGAPESAVVALGGAEVGRAYVFKSGTGTVDPSWQLQKVLEASSIEAGSLFGSAVDIIPGVIVVGAPGDGAGRGRTALFAINEGGTDNWGEIRSYVGIVAGAQCGAAVALSEHGFLAIGQPGVEVGRGAVTFYARNANGADNWGATQIFVYNSVFTPASTEAAGFGASLDFDGDRLLIGAPHATGLSIAQPISNVGLAFLFERDAVFIGQWGQVEVLANRTPFAGDFGITGVQDGGFGSDVALSGEWAAVTQPGQGDALIFNRNQAQIIDTSAPWGRTQALPGSSSVKLAPGLLVVADEENAVATAFRRSATEDYQWDVLAQLRQNAFGQDTGFATSLAATTGKIFVGAPTTDNGQGRVISFERQESAFNEITPKLTASHGAEGDEFGASVSLSGDTLAIGARVSSRRGFVYIFSRNQGGSDQWGQIQKLTASDGSDNDRFGESVSLSGDTLAVGVSGFDRDRGAVQIFSRNEGGSDQWGQVRKLTASDDRLFDRFGQFVSLSGDTLAVGARLDNIGVNQDQGSVYLFSRNQGGIDQWGELRKLTASDGAEFDRFGVSVSLSGDTLAIGAFLDDIGVSRNQGSVYLFSRNQGGSDQWGQVRKLTASDGAEDDLFGISVSLSGDTLAIGASLADIGVNQDQGSVYLFSRNQGGSDQWGEVRKLTASDGAEFDRFGVSVSLSGDTLAIGAVSDDTDGDQNQASAYLFSRNQSGSDQWGQLRKLTASDGAAGDLFGISVSLSGDTLAVGAYLDDIGANLDQGSVYLFQLNRSLFDEWKLEHFGATSVNNPGLEATVWGDLADPDGDGLSNLEEAYHDLNPLVADKALSSSILESAQFSFRWQRATDYQGIQAIPFWSPNLTDWYRSGDGPPLDVRHIQLSNRGTLLSGEGSTMEATIPLKVSDMSLFLQIEFAD